MGWVLCSCESPSSSQQHGSHWRRPEQEKKARNLQEYVVTKSKVEHNYEARCNKILAESVTNNPTTATTKIRLEKVSSQTIIQNQGRTFWKVTKEEPQCQTSVVVVLTNTPQKVNHN